MAAAQKTPARLDEVRRCLARVCDPELDEPITEMGFVERVELAGRDRVEVDFRLPTYWCSPNFAFLMADDIRTEISRLPWVARVQVQLLDHCYGDRVNRAVNDGTGFAAAFAEMSDGEDLEGLRAKFRKKAFQRRQEAMLLALQARGLDAAGIAAMTLAEYDGLAFATGEEAAQAPRYRALLTESGRALWPEDLAFRSWEGAPLDPARFADYLRELRGVRLNMEFNGALCRGLLGSRYKEVDRAGGEPELIDFILDRVPPREAAGDRAAT